ncbi:MAG TPA: hypothetical protein VFW05_14440 [Verrucomicrobiae bacterium]|nr:hypothetical protein [Verrucomicrobiae bacterium]
MSAALVPIPPTDNHSERLEKSELLAALDAQIKFASEAQRNEGWTRWAIWGALAAILWHGTELAAKPEFALSRSVLVSFLVFIIWVVLEDLIGLISPVSRVGSVAPVRFHLLTNLSSVVRPGVIASALQRVLIIVGLASFQFPNQWPLWTYAALSLLGDLLVFIPGMGTIAFPSRFGVRAAFSTLTLATIMWLGFAGWLVMELIQKDMSQFTLADVRFALLLNAAAYLLIRLTTATTSGHFLGELMDLRQHLAFGRISLFDAHQQTDKLLSGVKLSEIINPVVARVSKECEELSNLLKGAMTSAREIDELLSTPTTENAEGVSHDDAKRANVIRRIDNLDAEAARLDSKLKAVSNARSAFQIRAVCVALYSRESLPELQPSIQKVQEAFKATSIGVSEFHKRLAEVKSQFSRARVSDTTYG